MRARRVAAMAAFALRTNLRSAMTLGGVVALALIAGLGTAFSLHRGDGWALDSDLLFYGYLVAALFVIRSGLEQQREGGLDTYLRHNFATPLEHAAGAALSVLGAWLALTGILMALALLLSGGDLGTAAWHGWVWGLGLLALVPFVVMVESVSTFRIPMLLPVLGYLALMMVLAMTIGEMRAAAILGSGAVRTDPSTWLRPALRSGLVLAVGMAVYLAGTWARGRRSRALREVVPIRH